MNVYGCNTLMPGMDYIVWMNPETVEAPNERTVIVTVYPKGKGNLTSEDFEIDYGFYNKTENKWYLMEHDDDFYNITAWTCFPRPYIPSYIIHKEFEKDYADMLSSFTREQLLSYDELKKLLLKED